MENINKEHHDQTNRDVQNAEEFTNANPNANQNTDENDNQNATPAFTNHENKRLDTDPNRYANFVNTSESEESTNAGGYESPDRPGEINSASIDKNYPSEDNSHHFSRESRDDESDNSQDEIGSAEPGQQFFDGL